MKPLITKGAEQRRLAEEVASRTMTNVAELLLMESKRYRQMAGDKAIESLDSIGDAAAQEARRHLVRSETFKAAAALVAGGAK